MTSYPPNSSPTPKLSKELRTALAEKLKERGNAILDQDAAQAIESYTKAIELIRDNAIYYCNRAAAYTLRGRIG